MKSDSRNASALYTTTDKRAFPPHPHAVNSVATHPSYVPPDPPPLPFPLGGNNAEERRQRSEVMRHARLWDERCRKPRKHKGILGGNEGLAVLRAVLFHRNPTTRQLNPSYAMIAANAKCTPRTAGTYVRLFKKLGILWWPSKKPVRRQENGRWVFSQPSNAYEVRPHTEWVGYRLPPQPPPDPDILGLPEKPLVSGHDIVETEIRTMNAGDSSEHRRLWRAAESLGNAIDGKPLPDFDSPHRDHTAEDAAAVAAADTALRALLGDEAAAEIRAKSQAEKARLMAESTAALARLAGRFGQQNRNDTLLKPA